MKFQKIEIKNIASINEAVISFDSEPLANEPLFLICGATGSGKSTILDAICLALYGTAPRLEGYGNESYEDKKLNTGKDDNVKIGNPCQLVRRDTGEAYARLSFTGNDGLHYVATWNASRGLRKKLDAKLKVETSLYCVETDITINKETANAISQPNVVGLKFDEFCRTTLLAQGAFTRFLNSKSSEKSDILEKLTGTEIYSNISKEIYRSFTSKNQQYELKKAKIESLHLLTDEQREENTTLIKEEEKLIESLKKESEQIESKTQWLKNYDDYQKAQERALEQFASLMQQSEGAETATERKLLTDWERSEEARRNYVMHNELLDERKRIAQSTEQSQKKYIHLVADNKAMMLALQDAENQQKSIKDKIANAHRDIPMYENAGTLIAKMQEYMRKESECQAVKKDSEAKQQDLPKILREKEQLTEARKKAELVVRQKTDEHKLASDALQQHPSANSINARKEKIEKIASLLKEKEQTLERSKKLREKLDEIRKKVQDAESELKQKELEKTAAEAIRKQREEMYATMLLRIDNHAKALRAKLKVGDCCPVCGEKIKTIIQDSELMELIKPIETERDEAIKSHEERVAAYNETLLLIKSQSELEKETNTQLITENETDKKLSLQIEQLCTETNIATDADTLPSAIESERKTLNEQQQKREELSQKVLSLFEDLVQERQSLNSTLVQLSNITSQEKQANDILERNKLQIENIDSAKNTLRQEIADCKITITDWESNIPDTIDDIQKRTTAYNKAKEREQLLGQQVKELSEQASRISHIQQHIDNLYPAWSEQKDNDTVGTFTAKSEKEWMELDNACNIQKDNEQRINKEIAECEKAIESFHCNNSDITAERIIELSAYNTEQIRSIQQRHTEMQQSIEKNKFLAEEMKQKCDNLMLSRPQFSEEENMDTLTEKRQQVEQKRSESEKRVGALFGILEQDREKSKLVKQEKAEAKTLENEASKWKRLNDIFGSAEGNKFRVIAQSYILLQLLENANYYLRQFTTRYELTTQPGSLVILIKDREEEGVSRPVNTLSGGESFMVSLALALGLSSLSRNKTTPDTLFIDEGFGTLSANCLDTVIATLEVLHNIGDRRVGIISHVNELYERIATRIEIKKERGVSNVKIVG